ncbi:MAG TPA: hypothetical protein VK956_15360, partial [Verrucomicrobium sp.]|nr:hypothetical protein [Verrucomicrobium sp.]
MLLNHEKMIEKEYLVSLTIPGAKFPAVLPLRGTSQVAGEELESLLESNDRIKSAALFDALMRTTGIPRPSQPHEAAVFRTSTTGMQSRFQSLLGMRKSARMAGLILSRINSDDKGQMGVPGTSFSAMIGSSLAASWQDEGGWVEPVPVFKTVLAELALGLGDTPPAAAAAALGDFLKLVPGPCRKEILQWAATCEAGSPVHGLAQEMTTVWTLMEKVKTGTGNIGNATEWQHYEQLMGKEGLGAQMQFGLVAWWCQSARNDVPASMVVPATQIAARLWSRGDNVNLVDMVALLESFSSLPESPQWREAASDFAREWEKKTLAMRNGRTTFLQPDAWHASMAVLARLKDEVLLDMMFETYKSSVNRELWAVGLLARQGMPSYAARLLRENWATMTSIGSPSSVEVTCGSLPAPEVLEAFTRCFSSDEPDLALLGRYAMLAECKPRDGASMAGWDQAMEGLAADSVATPVKNAALRRVIHGLIVRASPPLQSKLADSLARDAAASLAELGRYQPSSPEAWPVELLAVDGAVKAVAGDPTVVSRNLEMIAVALRKDQPSNTWYRSSASGMYLLRLLECLAPSWAKLSEEHRAAVLQAMADELPGAGLASAGSGSDLEAVKWILDCWSSVSGKTSVQSNTSSPSSRVSGPSLVRVKSILFQMTGSGDARLSEELRLKLLAAMLVKPEVQNELTMAASSIPKLVESYPLVSKEELVKSAASSLAPSMRRGGRSCHELAVLAFHQGNEAEALRLLELAEAEPQAQPGGGEFRYAERPVRTGPAPVIIVPTTTGRLSWSRESIYLTRVAL